MNSIDLSGRCAVITGGAQGIGLAIAERLSESGASLSLWDADEKLLKTTADKLSARHHWTEREVLGVSGGRMAAGHRCELERGVPLLPRGCAFHDEAGLWSHRQYSFCRRQGRQSERLCL
jgi:NAD(P)-dependent dehydrogenase (short-subunit alcohol dehydrogenase family)